MEELTAGLTIGGYTAGVSLYLIPIMLKAYKSYNIFKNPKTEEQIKWKALQDGDFIKNNFHNLALQTLVLSLAAYVSIGMILSVIADPTSLFHTFLNINLVALLIAHIIADYGLRKIYCCALCCSD